MMNKRIFDFVAATIGLILSVPLFVIVACWIRLTSTGPVFFRQERIGRFGVPFKIIKFRTMFASPEPTREITVGRDARVTDIGRLLRRYKIDELPQLINVVRGEMSLVGPRPEVSRYVARYPEAVRATILSVPPGITDWASVEFRDESSILGDARDPERVYVEEILPRKLDHYVRYVNERSFLLDIKVLLATLTAIIR